MIDIIVRWLALYRLKLATREMVRNPCYDARIRLNELEESAMEAGVPYYEVRQIEDAVVAVEVAREP